MRGNFKVGELRNRRTPNSKTWINFDGSLTMEISEGIRHFQDVEGDYHDIDIALFDGAQLDAHNSPVSRQMHQAFDKGKKACVEAKAKGKAIQDEADFYPLGVPYGARIPKFFERGYSIASDGDALTFNPIGAQSSRGKIHSKKRNVITYNNAWRDVDVTLDISPYGVKETIVLKTDKAPTTFSFEVEGDLRNLSQLSLASAWAVDDSGKRVDVTEMITEKDDSCIVTYSLDVDGLQYPITIDPTSSIRMSVSALALSDYPNNNNNSTENNEHYVGRSGNPAMYRPYYKFEGLEALAGATINSAQLNLWTSFHSHNASSMTIEVNRVTGAWDHTTLTWNFQPSFTILTSKVPTVTQTNSTVPEQFTGLGTWVTNVAMGTWPNHGLMLRSTSETFNVAFINYLTSRMTTANAPTLVINFTHPPSRPSLTSPTAGVLWDKLHRISWTRSTAYSHVDTIFTTVPSPNQVMTSSGLSTGQTFRVDNTAYISRLRMRVNTGAGIQKTLTLKNVSGSVAGTTTFASGTVFTDASGYLDFMLPTPILFQAGTMLACEINNTADGMVFGNTTANAYANGNAYTGGNADISRDFWVEVTYNVDNAANVSYNVHLSTNNKVSWKSLGMIGPDVLFLDYDFTDEPNTENAFIRVRAQVPSGGYSDWRESGKFSIMHVEISPKAGHLGTLTTGVSILPFTITSPTAMTGDVVARIDGVEVDRWPAVSGTPRVLSLTDAQWDAVKYGDGRVLQIISSVETWTYTFHKRLATDDGLLRAVKGTADILEHLQAIKNALVSKVGGSGTFMDIINSIALGKKWAAGTTSTTGSSIIFRYPNNGTTALPFCEVGSLTFTPSTILIWIEGINEISILFPELINSQNTIGRIVVGGYPTVNSGNSHQQYIFRLSDSAYVSATGFRMPVNRANRNDVKWIAFE